MKAKPAWKFPDFHYSSVCEYDYDSNFACQNGSDCCDNDYCRCGEIVNIEIKSVDVKQLANEIAALESEIFRYCVWRLAVIHKIYDTEAWEGIVDGGYYGEEFGGVKIADRSFQNDVEECYELSDDDKVRFVLNKEYGRLLRFLTKAKFEVANVPVSSLIIPNKGYFKKVVAETYSVDYCLPIGVYRKMGKLYKLVDGYHRFIDLAGRSDEATIISTV